MFTHVFCIVGIVVSSRRGKSVKAVILATSIITKGHIAVGIVAYALSVKARQPVIVAVSVAMVG